MPVTQQQDAGLVQRGLLLLGGMTALVVVVLLIALRRPESPNASVAATKDVLVPVFVPMAPFPATPGWPLLVRLADQLPSPPGWEIRYNAAQALARRGSPRTPWDIIREMLDEDRQRRNFRVTLKNGQVVADVEDARNTVRSALSAVAQWHEKQDHAALISVSADLQLVYNQIDRLAQNDNPPLRVHAERVRQTINRH
jgi:HEAT repeat protein